jgi:hypothetical protein
MKAILSFAMLFASAQIFLNCPAACAAETAAKSASAKGKPANTGIKQALAQYQLGHFDKAQDLCLKVLAGDPKNLTAHYVLGNIAVKTNHIKDAVAQYQYCLQAPSAKTAPEAVYAQRALEQIRQQNETQSQAQRPLQSGPGNGSGGFGPLVGSTKSSEEYIHEQTESLLNEAKEKLAVKKHTLDDKVAQIQEDMKQQGYNLPRSGGRRMAAQEAKQEAQNDIKLDGQNRIDQLKKDFQREADDLNQSYQNRISALADHYHNLESQSAGRGGSANGRR